MTPNPSLTAGGRAAAIARRQALSAGKAALPPAHERVRNGERSAALPAGPSAAPGTSAAAPAVAAPATRPATSMTAGEAGGTSRGPLSGRHLSMQRRRLLAAGKQALKQATAVTPTAVTMPAAMPAASGSAASVPGAAAPAATVTATGGNAGCSCRAEARARRATLCQIGRGAAPPSAPSRPTRQGRLNYAPKVVESKTHARQTVTGSRVGSGSQVTGTEAGASLPVSGTQYIGADGGAVPRSGGPKVGIARTAHGGVVSGTLIRSRVAITGDEAGNSVTITGEAEQRPEDDLTERSGSGGFVSAQFGRQVDPHGHSIFGTNLGRSAGVVGSRQRQREAPLESTQAGLAITGSAVGRASRVTGDEEGACRHVTGDQYLSPARSQAECGGKGGGTAPAGQFRGARPDPVTGAKVSVAATWGQQRITGTDVEHNPNVTGDAPGSCAVITGTPYQGPLTMQGWCDPAIAQTAEERLPKRAMSGVVTGDTPRHDEAVTGTARGAGRAITGTPYYRDEVATPAIEDRVAALDGRFSVRSPMRAAQLQAQAEVEAPADAAQRITGSFAVSCRKITGNLEFNFASRRGPDREAAPAHARLTGEGRSAGTRISGDAWAHQPNVTGTEGAFAAGRNPSEREGKPQSFAGAANWKSRALKEDHKQLVTGMFGWSSKSAAKVTLSGGAQG